MIEAGSETTSQLLNNCIIGLLSNPELVKKAQEELDKVIGSDEHPVSTMNLISHTSGLL